MRRAPARLLGILCSLPPAGAALVILALPPVSRVLPDGIASLAQDLARPLFALVDAIPRDSVVGWIFYRSYDPLVPLFGSGAMAAHAALLALPWLALAIVGLRRGRAAPS